MYISIYVVNLNINNIHDEGNGELIRDDVALIHISARSVMP